MAEAEAGGGMLEKLDEFAAQKIDFIPWALKVCYFEVLADRRDRARDKHVFDDAALSCLSEHIAERSETFLERQRALAVRAGQEAVTAAGKLVAQPVVVVELAVDDDVLAAVRAGERLAAGLEVDDR